jgi:hypothetical protein
MDFYSVLQACYKKDITPFALYSQMCDLCKGDLKLYEKSRVLYVLYSNRDIFSEISLCEESDFVMGSQVCSYVKRCTKIEQACLTEVARLLHPDWKLDASDSESAYVVKIKTPKVENKKGAGVRVAPKFNAFQTPKNPTPQAQQTPVKNTPHKRKPKKSNVVKIYSLASDLVVKTSAAATDFEVYVLQNGIWTERKTGIGKHADMVYINLDGVVADKIRCVIPQEKYTAFWLDKVQGILTVEDDADCFAKMSITLASGVLNCKFSCGSAFLSGRVADISVQYTARRCGTLEIRGGLGDVKIGLQGVGSINDRIFAIHGKVENRYIQQANGCALTLKTSVEYGDIYVR